MLNWLVNYLIARAKRTPYYHLAHGDGSVYMGRWWLVPERRFVPLTWRNPIGRLIQALGLAVRIHKIETPDLDRALHDHPWNFVSVVLRGGYVEMRPISINPCFRTDIDEENAYPTVRFPGSVAYRRASDRHRIVHVNSDTYTLFITGPRIQWWGFYTYVGKVWHRDFDTIHVNTAMRKEFEHV